MSKRKQHDSFWLSYSDLMTSLFFIMLVLFVVCIVVLKSAPDDVSSLKATIIQLKEEIVKLNNELNHSRIVLEDTQDSLEGFKVREGDYKRLLNLGNTFKSLSANGSLQYVDEHKTFIAKDFEGIEIFEPKQSTIKSEYINTVDKVGRDLQDLLKGLNDTNQGTISYILIIEGNTANTWDYQFDPDDESAYNLSFQRAMSLYKHWLRNGINLRQYNTEIQICGSGMNGINRDVNDENNNKRFVIQILPKISRTDQ